MKKYLFIVLLVGVWSCEEKDEDNSPPTVIITSPSNQSLISEIYTITCMANDNNEIDYVQLWLNGSLLETDDSEPFSFQLNTFDLNDGNYMIVARAFDKSGNSTDSEPISLIVDNTDIHPNPSVLSEILYYGSFELKWSMNNDDDFHSYEIYESESEDMSNALLIDEINDNSDTTYTITNPIHGKFYQIITNFSLQKILQ